jgi:hypothetical protein
MDVPATKLVAATGDSVWTGDEMRASKRWIYEVTPRDIENMDFAVHNEILRTRPDLLQILYQPYYSDIRGEEPKGRKPYYAEPRFTMWEGKLFCQHGRTYIDSAQRFSEVPRLTPQMIEAMELIDKLANSDRYRLDMDFRPGDIQFLNNRVVVHSRTDFQDYAEPERKRHLLRLWLRTPGYDTLPPFFTPRFEDMDYWLKHPLARVA